MRSYYFKRFQMDTKRNHNNNLKLSMHSYFEWNNNKSQLNQQEKNHTQKKNSKNTKDNIERKLWFNFAKIIDEKHCWGNEQYQHWQQKMRERKKVNAHRQRERMKYLYYIYHSIAKGELTENLYLLRFLLTWRPSPAYTHTYTHIHITRSYVKLNWIYIIFFSYAFLLAFWYSWSLARIRFHRTSLKQQLTTMKHFYIYVICDNIVYTHCTHTHIYIWTLWMMCRRIIYVLY